MIKGKIKNAKGITLISLTITIIIIMMLANTIIYNIKDNVSIKNVKNMESDIEILKDKISDYYAQNGQIPANIKFTNIGAIKDAGVISNTIDTGDFFVIDLSAIDNLTLNYGRDFDIVKDNASRANEYKDLYIINEASHNIFYVEGIKINDKVMYTNYTKEDVDKEAVDFRYVNNIKIPDGFYYYETQENEIIIKSNDNSQTYKWIQVTDKIDSIPEGIATYTSESKQTNINDFIKSVNSYKGYYRNESDNKSAMYLDREKWSPYYDEEGIYKDKNGDAIYIPKDFCVCETSGQNTIDEGLVAKDKQNNEWVWIQVPKSIYKTATDEKDYKNIEADLIEYVNTYRQEGFEDSYYEGCGIDSADKYNELYNKMLSSVYTNGGFWISRYEMGDKEATQSNETRNGTTGITHTAVSQKDQIQYSYITIAQAQQLASKMVVDSNKTSSLLFGIQWDLVCKFLEMDINTKENDIKADSTNWGNYSNNNLIITSNNAKQNASANVSTSKWTDIKDKKTVTTILTTGASDYASKMNIYDLAGNLWEWTLEKNSPTSRTFNNRRGGCFNLAGNVTPVYNRRDASSLYGADEASTARVAIY